MSGPWPDDVEFVAQDFGDWVVCQFPDEPIVAFNRETGFWCRLPHPRCPIISVQGMVTRRMPLQEPPK